MNKVALSAISIIAIGYCLLKVTSPIKFMMQYEQCESTSRAGLNP